MAKQELIEMELRRLFLSRCVRHPKRHGEWYIYKFRHEETFLEMDSWNGAFRYAAGTGFVNYHRGGAGETVFRFGGNEQWDRDKIPQPDNVLLYYYDKLMEDLKCSEN